MIDATARSAAEDPAVVSVAREWIGNCDWPDLEPEDVDDLSADLVIWGVCRHWAGGLQVFLRECGSAIEERRTELAGATTDSDHI